MVCNPFFLLPVIGMPFNQVMSSFDNTAADATALPEKEVRLGGDVAGIAPLVDVVAYLLSVRWMDQIQFDTAL